MTERKWTHGDHKRPVGAGALPGGGSRPQIIRDLADLAELKRQLTVAKFADNAAANAVDCTKMSARDYADFKRNFFRTAQGLKPR